MKKILIAASLITVLVWVLSDGCSSTRGKPKTYTVEIKDMKFAPADITVKKGDTIVFVNNDMVTHDVTEETSKAWTSGPLPAGKSWKLVVTDEADYYCSIHAVMKGKIELE